VDAVLVVDQDRLTRHPRELEEFIIVADRLGVPLANVAGEVDLGSSDGRFRARIMGAVARQESEKKSERLKRQRDQQARMGLSTGGPRRFGYAQVRDAEGQATMSVIEDEAIRVREAADRFLAGESLRQIASDFNDGGISTVTGAPWKVTTLRTLLAGPHVAGLRVHRGEIIGEASWDAILERSTWEKIRAVLGDPRRSQSGRPAQYLLTGMLVCGRCGATLYSSRRKDGSRRYMCNRGANEGPCGRIAVVAEPVERTAATQLLVALAGPDLWAALEGVDHIESEPIARQLIADEASLEELAKDHYVERVISRREFLAARDLLEARISKNRAAFRPPPTNADPLTGLPRSYEALVSLWSDLDIERQRMILKSVVEEVVVHPGKPGRRLFDPDRVEMRWLV